MLRRLLRRRVQASRATRWGAGPGTSCHGGHGHWVGGPSWQSKACCVWMTLPRAPAPWVPRSCAPTADLPGLPAGCTPSYSGKKGAGAPMTSARRILSTSLVRPEIASLATLSHTERSRHAGAHPVVVQTHTAVPAPVPAGSRQPPCGSGRAHAVSLLYLPRHGYIDHITEHYLITYFLRPPG